MTRRGAVGARAVRSDAYSACFARFGCFARFAHFAILLHSDAFFAAILAVPLVVPAVALFAARPASFPSHAASCGRFR